MKMCLNSMKALYLEQLALLLNAERQLMRAIPRAVKAVNSLELREALSSHLQQTCTHIQRLERLIAASDERPAPARCVAMEGLIDEAAELIAAEGAPAVKDAAIITATQRMEHYEIAGYGCARTFADLLGLPDDAALLQTTLDDARGTDRRLTKIANSSINPAAAMACN